PAGFDVDVRSIERHLEGLEYVDAAGLHPEMGKNEVDGGKLPNDRIEFGGNGIRAVASMNFHEKAEVGADPHCRPEPVKCTVRPVGVHVRLQLDHLEVEFL